MNKDLYQKIVVNKSHRTLRRTLPDIAEEYSALELSPAQRMTRRFEWLCAQETPVILDGETMCFMRTVANIPDVFTPKEWEDIRSKHFIHELGYQSNVTVNYGKVLQNGLLALKEGADELSCRSIDALLGLVDRYRLHALELGREDIAQVLAQVPAYGARNFREALQCVRILNFSLWLEGNYHNTLGRFDQYLYPYFKADMDSGAMDEASALELIEEFFLSLNRDSDLYPGVQQGDNGQSLMLGGRKADGTSGFTKLSELCLLASRELKLIDPKINIRVDKDTPDWVYTLCSELTKVGLGFPQYSNDDIVIPGLIALGYAPEDAVEYTVAACWEYIIPGVGRDVANIAALSMPGIVDTCIHRDLPGCANEQAFLNAVKQEMLTRCDEIADRVKNLWFVPSPLLDTLMDAPKYQNYGVHGVGLSVAADSLAAIGKNVFRERTVTAQRLIAAIDSDFADDPELLHLLRYESPKLGCGSEEADESLCWLMEAFADSLAGRTNDFGGIWRAGTGSAMFYLWCADEIGASADGRRKGEPFAANYSISLYARPDGPFSILRSMTRPDLKRTINGGPLTLEFHDSMFSTPDAVEKVGRFVRQFILLGGHQLQLNAVNAETLRDAQRNPEKYPQLIVRIWGWSAYFVELDRAYQDHVIARQEYSL